MENLCSRFNLSILTPIKLWTTLFWFIYQRRCTCKVMLSFLILNLIPVFKIHPWEVSAVAPPPTMLRTSPPHFLRPVCLESSQATESELHQNVIRTWLLWNNKVNLHNHICFPESSIVEANNFDEYKLTLWLWKLEPTCSFSELMNATRPTSTTFWSLTKTFEEERRKFHSENSEDKGKGSTPQPNPNKIVISLDRDFNPSYKVVELSKLTCLVHVIFWHTEKDNYPDPITFQSLDSVVRVRDLRITHQPALQSASDQPPQQLPTPSHQTAVHTHHHPRRPVRDRLEPYSLAKRTKKHKKYQRRNNYPCTPPHTFLDQQSCYSSYSRRTPPRYSPTSPGYYSSPRRYSPTSPGYPGHSRRSPSPYLTTPGGYSPRASQQYIPSRLSSPSPERKRNWMYWENSFKV